METKSKKVSFFSKMSFKIACLVICAIIVPVAILTIITSINVTKTLKDIYMSYALNLAEEAVNGINFATDLGEQTYGNYAMDMAKGLASSIDLAAAGATSRSGVYGKVLDGVTISNVEGSYAYLVSKDGTMLYHTTADKIGKPVENAAVKGIVSDLAAGKTVEDGFIIYEYKDALKLAGYSFTKAGEIVVVTADYNTFMKIDYDTLIGEIVIKGVEGSYAYMVSPDGTMLYHKTPEKIGQPVENAAVKGIVEKLAAGQTVEDDAVVYEYKGADKLAGYAFTKTGNIVVVTADYDTFVKPIKKLEILMITVGLVMVGIFGTLGIIITSIMMKALENVIPGIKNAASLNLQSDTKIDNLCKRSDEVGVIANEIKIMQNNLGNIVADIKASASNIDKNVSDLKDISNSVNNMCADNFDISEELASGMQETSASTTLISENITEMKEGASKIEQMTIEGAKQSEEIMVRAGELKNSTDLATKNTMDIYTSVREKADSAIEAAQAVNKINELAETVMGISSQTSLLALNAAIEAARAGEAGRGFAVVANEISNLSVQTTTAVTNIKNILNEVNVAVSSMTNCLRETVEFLETTVVTDYQNFGKVSIQYKEDADNFKSRMYDVNTSISELTNSLEAITDSINGISDTMSDAAGGVSNIAGKTHSMSEETQNTANRVAECKNIVSNLNEIVSKFRI